MKITDIYLFSGTHWDREWYQSFRGFQSRLADMVDDMIDYLEKEDKFDTFHFDGQTIVLEDYKEIAPENEERLKKLIADGRIKVGPWYVMPDEFLLSGESLIRNLLTGIRLSKKWGADPWLFGYICDIFGHIAQMPQIFNGFDIKYSVLGRGTNENYPAFFIWQSPDGSECISYNLHPRDGYGNFSATVVRNINEATTEEELKTLIKNHVDEEIARSNTPVVILMDALDHQQLHQDTPKFIKIIKELYPGVNVHHTDLRKAGEMLEAVKETLDVKMGELNKTAMNKNGYLHLITDTLSSYYPIKKENDECQTMLEKVTEPLTAYLALAGKGIRRSYVDIAYKHLLQNHPHDSICGCSVDRVHEDVMYRFSQVKEIGEDIAERFLLSDKPSFAATGNYILKVYNTLPFEKTGLIVADIELRGDFPGHYSEPFGYESIPGFKIIDASGNEVPYSIKDLKKSYSRRVAKDVMANGECVTVSFVATLPAAGFAEFNIVPQEMPTRYLEKMPSGENFAENEHIKLTINSDGEVSIYDKKTKKSYENLLSLTDDGEIGDGWYHVNPACDRQISSKGSGAVIEKIENGPSRVVFKITREISVPSCIEETLTGKKRSETYVKIPVVTEVGLSNGARFADVEMKVDNKAKDHRMKLMLPTGIYEDEYFSGQTYYCNIRKTGIEYGNQNYRESDRYEKQTNGIVGKRDKNGSGIAFIASSGIHECSAYEGDMLSVTLLRAFKRTVRTMGEVNCEMPGEHNYSFMLAPIDSDVSYSDLVKLQDAFTVKPMYSTTSVKEDYVPVAKSFMKITGEGINVSIIKNPEEAEEGALIVRVYNASDKEQKGEIHFAKSFEKAYAVNLNEEIKEKVSDRAESLEISLSPWKIGTYKFKFQR